MSNSNKFPIVYRTVTRQPGGGSRPTGEVRGLHQEGDQGSHHRKAVQRSDGKDKVRLWLKFTRALAVQKLS